MLEGRDKVGKFGKAVGVLAITALEVYALANNDSDRK